MKKQLITFMQSDSDFQNLCSDKKRLNEVIKETASFVCHDRPCFELSARYLDCSYLICTFRGKEIIIDLDSIYEMVKSELND